jgi:hypothetical protein
MRALLLLLVAPLAVAHMQCGDVAPGKGLLHVQAGDMDVMCGFVMAQQDGPTRFETNVAGARVYVAKQLVSGPVMLKAQEIYAVHVEAPASPDFVLSWGLGEVSPIAPEHLYKPTATVGAACSFV